MRLSGFEQLHLAFIEPSEPPSCPTQEGLYAYSREAHLEKRGVAEGLEVDATENKQGLALVVLVHCIFGANGVAPPT